MRLGKGIQELMFASILISAVLFFHVILGDGRDVNFALFDLLIVISAAIIFFRNRCRSKYLGVFFVCGVIGCILMLHTGVIYMLANNFELGWALRELLKTIAVLVLFCGMLVVLETLEEQLPSARVAVLGIIVGSLALLTFHYGDLAGWTYAIYTPRTTFVASLWGIAILYLEASNWREAKRDLVIALAICLVVSVVSVITLSKIGAMIGVLTACYLCVCHFLKDGLSALRAKILERKKALLLGFAAAAVFLGAGIALILQYGDLVRLDSFSRSVSVRMELWAVSIAGFAHNWGLGVGLGQLVPLYEAHPLLGEENHRFPHNIFVGFLGQFGALGIVISVGCLIFLWRALQGYSIHGRVLGFAIIMMLASLHDILGVRGFIILLAIGFALFVSKSPSMSDNQRETRVG